MPPQEESTLASTVRGGDILALDPARSEFDAEFASEGARWVDGELELPEVVWREFAETAAHSLGVA